MKKTLLTLLSIAALCAADSAVAQQGRRGRRAAAQTGGGRRAAAPVAQAGRRGRGVAPVRQTPVYRAPVMQEIVFQEEVTAQPMPTKQGYWDRAKGLVKRYPKTAAGIGAGVAGAALLGGGAAAAYGTKGKYWAKDNRRAGEIYQTIMANLDRVKDSNNEDEIKYYTYLLSELMKNEKLVETVKANLNKPAALVFFKNKRNIRSDINKLIAIIETANTYLE